MRTGRSPSNHHHGQNRLDLGKTNWIQVPINYWVGQWETRTNLKTLPPAPPPFFPGSTSLMTLLPPLLTEWRREVGEQGMQSVHNALSLPLFLPHAVVLLQHGVPSMGYSSLETAPAWVLATGCSPSETDCSSTGPLQVLPENLLWCGLLSTACSFCQEPALAWALHGLQHGYLLQYGVLHGLHGVCRVVSLTFLALPLFLAVLLYF